MPKKQIVSPGFKTYLEAQETAEKLHGPQTIVMMQMGSFLEMYTAIFEDGTTIGHASDLGDILHPVGKPNDNIGKEYNGKKLKTYSKYGFTFLPETKERFITAATRRGYTVPVYFQSSNKKDPITKVCKRFLGETWTPTIVPEEVNGGSISHKWFLGVLMSSKDYVCMCVIQPQTRRFQFLETTQPVSASGILVEAVDFIREHPVSEVMIWHENEFIDTSILGIPEDAPIRRGYVGKTPVDTEIRKEVFKLVSSNYAILFDIPDIIVRSFDYLMSTIPDVMVHTTYHMVTHRREHTMRLENHCLSQLNIIDNNYDTSIKKKHRSVIGITDYTKTPMGYRTHIRWITKPSTHLDTIQRRINLGKSLIEDEAQVAEWTNVFSKMSDLDRLFSSEILGGLSYSLLYNCMLTIDLFLRTDTKYPLTYGKVRFPVPHDDGNRFIKEIRSSIVPPESLPYNGNLVGDNGTTMYGEKTLFEFPFTKEGCDEELWKIHIEHTKILDLFTKICKVIGVELGYANETYVFLVRGGVKKHKIKENGEKEGIKWKYARSVASSSVKKQYELDMETRITPPDGNTYILRDLIYKATRLRRTLSNMTRDRWLKWSRTLRDKYQDNVRDISSLIGELDAVVSGIKSIYKNGYTYPNVSNDSSWVSIKGMRHPIIETLKQDTTYIPHNIELTKDTPGRLIFGINSSGKSSLMKAVGISVILAQAGLPVPAKYMGLGIYKSMFARIVGNDNIFKGMSTFAVEASELARIMKTSDKNSLVLGDELCSGTEQNGAEAIVAGSILKLLERNVSFVFATHLHRLRFIPDLASHPKLWWSHIHVECTEDGKLVMHRTLEDGPGPSGYAIDFIKNMGGDPGMIQEAKRVYKMITSEEFAKKSSREWNSEGSTTSWNPRARVQTKCPICKERDAEEVDHIIGREHASKDGGLSGIGNVHHGGNFAGLCKICHRKKTQGEIEIRGYKEVMSQCGITERVLEWEEHKPEPEQEPEPEYKPEIDETTDMILRFSCSGNSIRQIQNCLRRNGHKVSQALIRETLQTQHR